MNTKEIRINKNDLTAIERLAFEYETLKDTVAYIITNSESDSVLDTKMFKRYQTAEITARMAFERGKKEIEAKYVPAELISAGCRWSLEYKTGVITVTHFWGDNEA